VPPASTEMASKDDEVPELEQIEHRLDWLLQVQNLLQVEHHRLHPCDP
jgi:hypothetical protein